MAGGLQPLFAPLRANSAWLGWEPCTAVCPPQAIGWGKAEYCCWHFDPKECKDARVLLTWKDEFIFAHSFSCIYLCECNLLIIKNKIVTKINHFVCLYCVMVTHLFHEKTDQTESKTTDLDFLFRDLLWKTCFMKHVWLWCYNPVINTLN